MRPCKIRVEFCKENLKKHPQHILSAACYSKADVNVIVVRVLILSRCKAQWLVVSVISEHALSSSDTSLTNLALDKSPTKCLKD
jgi:hypothetical protein